MDAADGEIRFEKAWSGRPRQALAAIRSTVAAKDWRTSPPREEDRKAKKLIAVLAVAVAASLAVVALAFGARVSSISVSAKLNAKQEVPAQVVKDTKAKGKFTGTLVGSKLTWKLTVLRVDRKVTAAHIHLGAMGKAGNVAIPLCGPCKNGRAPCAALKKALKHHKLYVNVHTATNLNGEIRGQLAEM